MPKYGGKSSGGGFGWKGVSTGTPCSNPKDNANPDYSPKSGGGDWRGVGDSTPSADGKSDSVKISGGGGSKE